jgi:hypothetical protein
MAWSRHKSLSVVAAVVLGVLPAAATATSANATTELAFGCDGTGSPGVGWRYVRTYVGQWWGTGCAQCNSNRPGNTIYCWDLGTGNASYWVR